MFFREAKTVTLIIRHDVALHHGLLPAKLEDSEYDCQYQYPCRMITCNVHSSLEAVGFMAHLATKLAERGISVNPVSAYYHDHLFVPAKEAEEALRIAGVALRSQSQSYRYASPPALDGITRRSKGWRTRVLWPEYRIQEYWRVSTSAERH
jgi:hypothetical protein